MKKAVKDQDQGSPLAKDLARDQVKGLLRLLQRNMPRDRVVGLPKVQGKDPLRVVNLAAQQAAI